MQSPWPDYHLFCASLFARAASTAATRTSACTDPTLAPPACITRWRRRWASPRRSRSAAPAAPPRSPRAACAARASPPGGDRARLHAPFRLRLCPPPPRPTTRTSALLSISTSSRAASRSPAVPCLRSSRCYGLPSLPARASCTFYPRPYRRVPLMQHVCLCRPCFSSQLSSRLSSNRNIWRA